MIQSNSQADLAGRASFLARAAPPARLLRDGSTALATIDLQYHDAARDRGFNLALERIWKGSACYFNDRVEHFVIPTTLSLLNYFRANKLPVLHIVIGSDYTDYRDLSSRLRDWIRFYETGGGVPNILWAESSDFEILKELAPEPNETILRKRTFSAFNSTSIEQILRERGIQSVIIVGVVTSGCVEATARDAADLGFGCVIVDEGAADYDQSIHDASLTAFRMVNGRVSRGAEDTLACLERGGTI
jgi:nicotinamidase-related amidase